MCIIMFEYHNFISILESFKNILEQDEKNINGKIISNIRQEYFVEINKYISKN